MYLVVKDEFGIFVRLDVRLPSAFVTDILVALETSV
jgi:hypothetical protein